MQPLSGAIARREALRRTALLLGGAISAPTLAAMLAGCDASRAPESTWTPKAFSNDQGELVATIAEMILPQTNTAGARSAGVHRFIDTMLAEYYAVADRARFFAGLSAVDDTARRIAGKRFLDATPDQRHAILVALDRDAYPVARAVSAEHVEASAGSTEDATGQPPKRDTTRTSQAQQPAPPQPPAFFRTMKELTLLGYYTSLEGMTRELQHQAVPGRFAGCVPLASVGRAWAL